ncbi:MAG: hypothetical protein JNL58_08115 [Planctomyces sp.]|nr:hypothetical protein [Planctomyces sp.]
MNFLTMLAQNDSRIDGAVRITEQASSLGGNVFVVTLVLLIVVVYVIGVVIPGARSQRANTDRLTDCIARMGDTVAETHGHAAAANTNTQKLILAQRVQTRIAEKLNMTENGSHADITAEIGEIRGTLA